MGGHPQHVCSRVGGRGRHRALRCHGVAVRARRRVRAVPDLRQRTVALRIAPRSQRSRLPSHVRRPYARSKDAAVTSTLGKEPGSAQSPTRGEKACRRLGPRIERRDVVAEAGERPLARESQRRLRLVQRAAVLDVDRDVLPLRRPDRVRVDGQPLRWLRRAGSSTPTSCRSRPSPGPMGGSSIGCAGTSRSSPSTRSSSVRSASGSCRSTRGRRRQRLERWFEEGIHGLRCLDWDATTRTALGAAVGRPAPARTGDAGQGQPDCRDCAGPRSDGGDPRPTRLRGNWRAARRSVWLLSDEGGLPVATQRRRSPSNKRSHEAAISDASRDKARVERGNRSLIGVVLGQRGDNLITAGLYAAKQLVDRGAKRSNL